MIHDLHRVKEAAGLSDDLRKRVVEAMQIEPFPFVANFVPTKIDA